MKDFHKHVSAAAKSVGAPEPEASFVKAVADHPAQKQFEGLLAQHGAAHAPGGSGGKSVHAAGDKLARDLLLAFLADVDQAEATGDASPFVRGAGMVLRGYLLQH